MTYWDHGTDSWVLQYDSAGGGAYESAAPVTKTGTDTWKAVQLTLPDTSFTGAENGGADFRISSDGTGDAQAETIAKVSSELSGDSVVPIHLCQAS